MSKENIRFLVILILMVIITWHLSRSISNIPVPDNNALVEKVSKLELKIDSLNILKKEIRESVDSTHIKIITNEKHYQEVVNTIISQPMDSDYLFITSYIRQHAAERDSSNLR